MKNISKFPYYFLVFSLYPALALMSHNISEDHLTVIIRPLLFSIILSAIVFLMNWLLFRDSNKAGLYTLVFTIAFFSFGHLLSILSGASLLGIELGRIRILGIIVLFILVMGFFLIRKSHSPSKEFNLTLIVVSLVLVVFPVINILIFNFHQSALNTSLPTREEEAKSETNLPDIYFIILDSYTRQDALQNVYHYDNQSFLNQLHEMGFYIAECSMSNYQYTLLSLSSTLNMDYLPNIDKRIDFNNYQSALLTELIKHNKVRTILSDAGYKFITIENSYIGTQIPDADLYIRDNRKYTNATATEYLTPFEEMFIKTTAGVALYRLELGPITDWVEKISFPYSDHANNQLFQLNSLASLTSLNGPKFVYVHMNIPHRPFIFQPDGKLQTDPGFYGNDGGAVNMDYEIKGYVDQIKFLNNRLPNIIKEIVSHSKNQPIIIIQGDHGLDMNNRSLILNSYYPADRFNASLYPSISPVNSFRVVLNSVLGTSYNLLPDKSYASPSQERFIFSDVYDPNPSCK